MNSNLNSFFKLTPDYLEELCEIAGRAFQDDPTPIFTYPDETERREKLKYGFRMIYKYGIIHGESYATSENLEGFIVWLPPDKVYPSTWIMMRYMGFSTMRKVGFKIKTMKRTMAIFNYMEERHKELAPYDHWYLQNITVDPEEQGKGYGSQLLTAMYQTIDSEGLPIYLDTNQQKNLPFYQKHGFKILEHVMIPDTDVPLWCMLRKPSEA